MGNFTSINEVLDFAIEQEIGAQQFYLNMAESATIPEMKKVFEGFATEEKGHQAKLETLKKKSNIAADVPDDEVQDLGLADYLVDVEPQPDMDYKDALILAMKKGKAAYRLYLDLAAISQSGEIKEAFRFLAQEEAKHKLRFEIEYDDIVLMDG